MVEARVRRLPGYTPMPEHDDGMSEAGAFLWRLGDAFELWDEQGDALEEDEMRQACQPGAQAAGPLEVRVLRLPAQSSWELWLMQSQARQGRGRSAAAVNQPNVLFKSLFGHRMQGSVGTSIVAKCVNSLK